MCNCGGGTNQVNEEQLIYTVTYPDGSTRAVVGKTAAKIEVTQHGGRYEKRS